MKKCVENMKNEIFDLNYPYLDYFRKNNHLTENARNINTLCVSLELAARLYSSEGYYVCAHTHDACMCMFMCDCV